jgi:amidase
MPDALARLDATAQAEIVRRREASPRDLVDAAIARIERLNPQLNAVIHPRFAAARAEADRLATTSEAPFHGVPLLVKDFLCHLEGEPIHLGTRFLRDAGFVAPHDAYLTQKLRAAGFIIVGRTNTPELGTLPTTEPDAYGATHNPWKLGHSTGGSSGGSAASVAAGFTPVAHANDGGGSIRIPASACGVVGLKPSRGRTSLGPDVGDGMGGLVSEGVVTRSVRDTAAVLDAIAGAMPGDPYTAPPPARPYRLEPGAWPGRLRIGMMTRPPGNIGMVHPEAQRAVEKAARLLADAGHTVEESHPDALDEGPLQQHFGVMYCTSTAHLLDAFGEMLGRTLGPDDVDPLNWAMAETGRAMSAPMYLSTVDWLQAWTRRMAHWWVGGYDLLLTPTLPEPPPVHGTFTPDAQNPLVAGARAQMYAAFTSPFNLTGQPAISLPLHWTDDDLPLGAQLVGAYGREDLLLRVAGQLEEAAPWADRWPALVA